ncbi:subtilisin-like protease SBT1.8 [Hibiscus syriacus]|uniref:subtilisin-like protease SBT1.8 n=1 Tax=Hibiscus syriacus TaxID=106335 RepID=UPI0019221D03|nr:subtilisin-like protease SBT1.8 [Hibiscus syriacus]
MVTPQILKPDIIGPGVNILAAWSEAIGPTGLVKDPRRTEFNIMSAQDNTNSSLLDATNGSPSNPWVHGAGHVDPHKALSPGLIYDISVEEYIAFLCSLGYTIDQVNTIVKRPNITCSKSFKDPGELNYPSFSVLFGEKRVVRYSRELTNVGPARSIYKVTVNGPSSVRISVRPRTLVFRHVGEKKRYTVRFVAKRRKRSTVRSEFGSIAWGNAQNQVKSPVAFSWALL